MIEWINQNPVIACNELKNQYFGTKWSKVSLIFGHIGLIPALVDTNTGAGALQYPLPPH